MRAIAVLITAAVLVGSTPPASARPVVVELFTSEGCSSCPPADALLTELSSRSDLLPLAFHVTCWNSLGWRDPFSFEGATTRQASYAAQLGGGSYTPEMVVDGRRGMVGSQRAEVAAAIAAARGPDTATSATLTTSAGGVTIAIGAGSGRGRILLIGFDPRHQTHIGRGENGGRTLVESNIVRSMNVVGSYTGSAVQIAARRGAGAETAVIVQAADGRIIAAARL